MKIKYKIADFLDKISAKLRPHPAGPLVASPIKYKQFLKSGKPFPDMTPVGYTLVKVETVKFSKDK